ncbi:MAG: zinc-ribbon domain-containing protein [Thermoleophilaceae bacterium]|nr:zinc-ribbon domain-containing protein [Thermoleophilaceae bacterium]
MSSPDLFVVCKNCGSEVSPYVTECPYCGQRVRKRAPTSARTARRLKAVAAACGGDPRRGRRASAPSPPTDVRLRLSG